MVIEDYDIDTVPLNEQVLGSLAIILRVDTRLDPIRVFPSFIQATNYTL